jgi:hypothetical protein
VPRFTTGREEASGNSAGERGPEDGEIAAEGRGMAPEAGRGGSIQAGKEQPMEGAKAGA